ISNHTIEILRRLVSHSAFNEIAANFLQMVSDLCELLRSESDLSTILVLLNFTEIMVHSPVLKFEWRAYAAFVDIIRFYSAHADPELAEVATKVYSVLEDANMSTRGIYLQ
ncbi:hypothetical protein AB6A40_011724, partial [Gnathostoma spinigerum]